MPQENPTMSSAHVSTLPTSVLDSEVRPWGSWYVLDSGPGYKIKRIQVHPGARLSLQSHAFRSEHWVVVYGVAHCTVDDRELVAGPGSSVDVPVGARHRIANHGAEELVIIEVQRGYYTGEDDICRHEDDYGRTDAADVPDVPDVPDVTAS
jgi:mannose-6-phosphate isomerase